MSDCPFCNPKIDDEKVHLFMKVVHNGKDYAGHIEVSAKEKSPEEIIRIQGNSLVEAAIRTLRNRGVISSSELE